MCSSASERTLRRPPWNGSPSPPYNRTVMSIDRSVMMERLGAMSARYEELLRTLADPAIFTDPDRYQQVAREQATLASVVSTYRQYLRAIREMDEAAQLAREETDPDLREMARTEETRL